MKITVITESVYLYTALKCECKRYTTCHIASTHSAILSLVESGVPHLVLAGGEGYPMLSWLGIPLSGLAKGGALSCTGWGYPMLPPGKHLGPETWERTLDWGTPSPQWWTKRKHYLLVSLGCMW